MTTLLIASNILLWMVVLALASGYLSLLRERPSDRKPPPVHQAPLSPGSLIPELVGPLQDALHRQETLVVLFTSHDCEVCSRLLRMLRTSGDELRTPIFLVGPSDESWPGAIGQVSDEPAVAQLRGLFGIEGAPHAVVLAQRTVRAAGVVNTPADIRELSALATL